MKYWVFDLDGTLVDSFGHYFNALSEVFQAHGARFTPELHFPALTHPLTEFFGEYFGKDAVQPALRMLQEKSNADARVIRPFSGITNAVESLAGQGARIGVWTNRDWTSARLILDHSGLGRYAEICVSGTCVTQRKPHPEGLLRIIDHFGCETSSVTVVGDHDHDVLAAKEVGARAVRASWHSYWEIERCMHADSQFFDSHEFANWAVGTPIREPE